MSQYAFPLALPPVFSADNFFVSGCNRDAWRWVNAWPDWPSRALIVYGPKDCGKSHLGHIWSARARAAIMEAPALPHPDTAKKNQDTLIENIEQAADERLLLHWCNVARENGFSLLLTSSLPPPQLPFTLPDLTSRLLALPAVSIERADDEVLAGAMRKLFADRQMKVEEDVIAYILPRIERSLSSVREVVDTLDRHALEAQRNITIPFVKRILG
jgi:chromosomal replication initiation ATPase DnaA